MAEPSMQERRERDFPNNAMFLQDAHFMKTRAYEPAEYAETMEFLRSCAAKESNVDGGESEPAGASETSSDDSR